MSLPAHIENAQKNREAILDAASELMSERGFATATVAAICKKAGVMPPTLYWHFGDKEGLLAAVMKRAADRWFEAFIPGGRLDPTKQAPAPFFALFREGTEFLRILLLLALERREIDDGVRASVERVRERGKQTWSAQFEELLSGIASHKKRRAAAGLLSDFLLAQLDGFFVASQLNPGKVDLQGLARLTRVSLVAAMQELVSEARRESSGGGDRRRRRTSTRGRR